MVYKHFCKPLLSLFLECVSKEIARFWDNSMFNFFLFYLLISWNILTILYLCTTHWDHIHYTAFSHSPHVSVLRKCHTSAWRQPVLTSFLFQQNAMTEINWRGKGLWRRELIISQCQKQRQYNHLCLLAARVSQLDIFTIIQFGV